MPETIVAHEVSPYCPPPRLGDGQNSSYTPLTDDFGGGERVVDLRPADLMPADLRPANISPADLSPADLTPETDRAPDWDAARIADSLQQTSNAADNQA